MQVSISLPTSRKITLEADLSELQELFYATRQGRRTKRQQAHLEKFGNLLVSADPELERIVDKRSAHEPAKDE